MAASTLHSFLIKLGFDIAGLRQGGREGTQILGDMKRAAQELQAAAAPVSGTVASIGAASGAAAPQVRQLVTASEAAAQALRAQYAAAGPVASASQMQANAMRAAQAAAGPLVVSQQGLNAALMAAAPAANAAGQGFFVVGRGGQQAFQGVQQANAALNATPPAANRAATALRQVAAAADHASARGTFMQRVLSMAFAFSGGVAVTTLFGFIGNAILGFNARLEQSRIAFETLLGNAGAAERFIMQMQKFADLTPFTFEGVENAAQRLMAMGFAADQVLPVLTAVGDAVAALGGSSEKLDRITIALGQMATAGRVNAQDMRQLTEAGIPAWAMLAEGIGKSVAETRKLAEEGLIPASQALNILVNSMEERFGGLMQKQARTAAGAFTTIRDVALRTISSAVDPLFRALSSGLVGIADFLLSGGGRLVAPAIQAIGVALAVALIPRLYQTAVAAAGTTVALGTMTVPLLPLIIAVTALGTAWQENFGGIRTTLGPLIGTVLGFADSALRAVAATGLLVPAIIALATAITAKLVIGLISATASGAGFIVGQIALAVALRGTTVASATAIPVLNVLGTTFFRLGTATAASLGPLTLLITLLGMAAIGWKDLADARERMMGMGLTEKQAAAVQMQQQGDPRAMRPDVQRELASIPQDVMAKIKASSGELAATDPMGEFAFKFTQGVNEVGTQNQKLVDLFGTSMAGVMAAAREGGSGAMLEMAKGILETQNAPVDAFKQMTDMLASEMTPRAQIARDIGILTSSELARGLASQDPAVRAAAIATQQTAIDNLNRITEGAFRAGTQAGYTWQMAFKDAARDAGDSPAEITRDLRGMSATDVAQAAAAHKALSDVWKNEWRPSADAARAAMARLRGEIESGSTSIANAASEMVEKFGNDIEAIKALGETAGGELMANVAKGIAQNADAPLNAMKDLVEMQKAELSSGAQQSRLIGLLISKQLAQGMASSSPAVVAQAVATRNFLIQELNRASNGAYAAGAAAIIALAQGMISPAAFQALNRAAAAVRFAQATAAMAATGDFSGYAKAYAEFRAAQALVVPDFNAARNAANNFFNTLTTGSTRSANSFKTAMADAKDRIRDAFGEIKRAARDYFDEVHQGNLKSIEETRRLADIQADMAANAFRAAITAERAKRREAELRQALAEAKTPAEQMEAQQNLVDFLQDQELIRLEEAAEAQKKLNEQRAAEQKAAENKRYADQIAQFNAELASLQKYLLRHPEEWRRMNAMVLSLLAKYGITYISAGSELGSSFATGLRNSVSKAVSAAHALAEAAAAAFNERYSAKTKVDTGKAVPTPPPVPKTGGAAKVPMLQEGSFRVLEDNLLALLHRDEMVAPREIAGLLRTIASAPITGGSRPNFNSIGLGGTASAGGASLGGSPVVQRESEGGGGGRTIILQLDGRELARWYDEDEGETESRTVVLRPGTR